MALSDVEFARKVDWEGGVEQALLDYGLSADDLSDKNTRLYHLVAEFDKLKPSLVQLISDIEEEVERLVEDA